MIRNGTEVSSSDIGGDTTGSDFVKQIKEMDEESVPTGWKRLQHNGRVVYSSPPSPNSVLIRSHSELSDQHRKGRFLEVRIDQLVFTKKRRKKEKKYETKKKALFSSENPDFAWGLVESDLSGKEASPSVSATSLLFPVTNTEAKDAAMQCESDQFDSKDVPEITAKERSKLEKERSKLTEAISRLTIDPTKHVDHKVLLEAAAKRLSDARLNESVAEESFDLEGFKNLIKDCHSVEEMIKIIWVNPRFQLRFSHIFSSKLLEQLLALGSVSGNPLKSFPLDVNTNAYVDILHFALDNSEDVLLLLTALTKKNENPISSQDVIDLAYLFSTLAEAACSRNNSLKKTKTLCLKSSGLTNSGLDSLASVGGAETSRSCRNDRDMLASISEEVLKQYAKSHVPQMCFDNMDIRLNNVDHHLTLNYYEFEQSDTSAFQTDSKGIVFQD